MKLLTSKRGTVILSDGIEVDDNHSITGCSFNGQKRGFHSTWNGRAFRHFVDEIKIKIDNKRYFLINDYTLIITKYNRDNDCLIDLKNKTYIPIKISKYNTNWKEIYKENFGKVIILKNEDNYN